jgi:hypothetical protein
MSGVEWSGEEKEKERVVRGLVVFVFRSWRACRHVRVFVRHHFSRRNTHKQATLILSVALSWSDTLY